MPPRIRRAPARRTAPEEVPDRVSALPDEALHAVLSLLPAHDAVRTCVLARRWRHLWEHAPALRVTDVEGWNPRLRGEAGLRKFIRFVDGLFVSRRRCDAPLELCDLDFDFPEEDKGKDWHVNRWIMLALLRHHARVLRISLPAYVALPDVPLISQRLTRLELDGVLGNDNILDFSCCPALIALKMKCCRINAEKMSSPSVKILSLASCEFYPATRTQMSFPSVVSLELDGCSGSVPFLESMPSLVAAIVRFDDDYADRCDNSVLGDCGDDSCVDCCNYSDRSKCVCLNGLLEATHLELSAEPAMYVIRRDLNLLLACHTFAKLKTLVLGEWCMTHDLSALIRFLQQSPILEKLTIKIPKEPKCSMDAGQQKIPEEPFVSNHLKIVEIKCKGKEVMWVCKFLKTLGSFGIPLEKINIKLTSLCLGWPFWIKAKVLKSHFTLSQSTLRLVATRGARARHLFDGAARPAGRAMASGADRISDLPEDVLHHVLSLLPSRDAVRTCVLAQRWRDLWRSVPAVRVAGARGWASADAFVLFVDRLLRLRRGRAALDTCDLDLRFDGPFPGGEQHGNRWIRRALRRQVRVLRFLLSTVPRVPLPLPDSPLVSDSLTTLELKGVLGNNQVLDFSSCPSLVDLKMEDCYVGGLEMWSPTVRNLSMRYCFFYSNYRARIDFPSLVSFKFNKNLGRTPLLERMPSLATATVRLDHFCDDRCSNGRYDDCGDAECKGCHDYYAPSDYGCVFLEGLTEAKDLKLSAYSDVYLFNRDLKCCSIFSKLKNLVLNAWFVAPDLSALTWFLQYAPLLERLTLKVSEVPNNLVETEGSYSQLEQSFAASHLQIVEIKCKEVHGIILKILEVLNANGIPLEKISIRCSGRFKFVCTGIDSEN
uniref:F-box domain-containing protein n=1 Tax=Oryza glumipatula TaxID=40148 RepID=A0A0E0BGI5_9ORYZ